jgi:hypothetical protein
MIHYNSGALDGRLSLFNCRVTNQSTTGSQPTIHISKGMLKMQLCEVSGSSNVNILKIDGSARLDSIVLSTFTSNTTSQTAAAIVELSSTGTTYTFNNCAFVYGSSVNKSASTNSCGILCSSQTNQATLILSYNSFFLLGTSQQSNYVVQDSNFGNARQSIILFFSNNASVGNASVLRGTAGVSKISLQSVA